MKHHRTRQPLDLRSEADASRVLDLLDSLDRPRRRVTVADHERFRETLRNPFEGDADLADEGRGRP